MNSLSLENLISSKACPYFCLFQLNLEVLGLVVSYLFKAYPPSFQYCFGSIHQPTYLFQILLLSFSELRHQILKQWFFKFITLAMLFFQITSTLLFLIVLNFNWLISFLNAWCLLLQLVFSSLESKRSQYRLRLCRIYHQ